MESDKVLRNQFQSYPLFTMYNKMIYYVANKTVLC